MKNIVKISEDYKLLTQYPINGNLMQRRDNFKIPNLIEDFEYDNSDRLTTVTGPTGLAVNYFDNGNIKDKSDAATGPDTYKYYDPVKLNALTKINNPTNISQLTQNVIYTPYNKAQTITEDTYELNFTYGTDDQRKKTVLKNNSVIQSTRFFSGDYEKTISGSNTTEVHYINCSSGLVAMYIIENGNGAMYFPYTDYLGSILAVTDQQGNITAEQSFDAWGRNRHPDDWTDQSIPGVPSWLYRGYTMHEHLPAFALVNMNGRMYDPVVGRMLSPDNNLQAPDYSQNHNRYSYALNNPLKFVDPSGNYFDDAFSSEGNPIEDFFRGVRNILRGDPWGAKHNIPKNKVKQKEEMVFLRQSTHSGEYTTEKQLSDLKQRISDLKEKGKNATGAERIYTSALKDITHTIDVSEPNDITQPISASQERSIPTNIKSAFNAFMLISTPSGYSAPITTSLPIFVGTGLRVEIFRNERLKGYISGSEFSPGSFKVNKGDIVKVNLSRIQPLFAINNLLQTSTGSIPVSSFSFQIGVNIKR